MQLQVPHLQASRRLNDPDRPDRSKVVEVANLSKEVWLLVVELGGNHLRFELCATCRH